MRSSSCSATQSCTAVPFPMPPLAAKRVHLPSSFASMKENYEGVGIREDGLLSGWRGDGCEEDEKDDVCRASVARKVREIVKRA